MNLALLTSFTALSTVILLAAGALVVGTGSGLAVPDWPLSFGQFFPLMEGGVLYEHGHRLVAGFVAFLTVVQCGFILKLESRSWVKALALFSVALVLTQALLGGLTVLFLLPKGVSIAHACLAQTFFCTITVLMLVCSSSWKRIRTAKGDLSRFPVRYLAVAVVLGFFLQLLAGATMRHFGAGLAIPDFPLSFGKWLPPGTPQDWSFPVGIHFAHRLGAFILVGLVAVLITRVYRLYWNSFDVLLYAGSLMGFIWIQVMLGAMVIWMRRPLSLTTIHLVVGALCLASAVLLTVQLFRVEYDSKLRA